MWLLTIRRKNRRMRKLIIVLILALVLPFVVDAEERVYLANFDVAAYPNADMSGSILKQYEAGDEFKVVEVNEEEHWVKILFSDDRAGYVSLDAIEWLNDPSKRIVTPAEQQEIAANAVVEPVAERKLTSAERDAIKEAELVERGLAVGPKMRIVCGIWLALIAGIAFWIALRYNHSPLDEAEKKKCSQLIGTMSVLGFLYVVIMGTAYSLLAMSMWMLIDVDLIWGIINGIIMLLFGFVLITVVAPKVPLSFMIDPILKRFRRDFEPAEVIPTRREMVVAVMFWLFLLVVVARVIGLVIMIAVTAGAVMLVISIFGAAGGFSDIMRSNEVKLTRNPKTGEIEDAAGCAYDIDSKGRAKKR